MKRHIVFTFAWVVLCISALLLFAVTRGVAADAESFLPGCESHGDVSADCLASVKTWNDAHSVPSVDASVLLPAAGITRHGNAWPVDIQRVCYVQGEYFHTPDSLCSDFPDASESAVIYPTLSDALALRADKHNARVIVSRVASHQSSYAICAYVDGWGDADCEIAALFGGTFIGTITNSAL